ncbi:MAG: hypothetical protein ACP5HQ_07265 [Thermoprotei archaeon]
MGEKPVLSKPDLLRGIAVSAVAAVAILALLVQLQAFGYKYAFSLPAKLQMFIVWLLAIPAAYFYMRSRLSKAWVLKTFAPLAIATTALGLSLLLLYDSFMGLELIILGYFFEPIAGISIYLTVKRYGLASLLFFLGAVAYTAGLPLYLYDFGYLSIIGDSVKLAGLLALVRLLGGEGPNR